MDDPRCLWTSPVPSQAMVDGPELQVQPGQVILRYRGEGYSEWIELRFKNILKVVFTEFSACSPEDVIAYDRLLDLGNTTAFARDVFRTARRNAEGMRHFRFFIDDVGVYDILAHDVEISDSLPI